MQCDCARVLMSDALDGVDAPGLDGHLAACPACAAEWSRLRSVDARLRAQPLIAPPAHFGARLLHQVVLETCERPAWQRSLMHVGVVVSGTLMVLVGVTLLLHGWRVTMPGTPAMAQVAAALRGVGTVGAVVWELVVRDAVRWPLSVALAIGLAAAWFGALVVPRFAERTAR
jgi:anti-sigma factor RsiW